jgi:tripartite-type tricarboxylate transporter receptor subunit TctC
VIGVALAALAAMCGVSVACAADAGDFYSGKTVHILVGSAAGGPNDLVGRVLAAHLGDHISGNPGVVVENMPGAASLVMMNSLYGRAARDGTVMGIPLNGIVLEPRLKILSRNGGTVGFDLAKMSWIGTPAQEPTVLWVWHETPFQTAEDLKKNKLVVGATAPGADAYTLALLADDLIGTKIEIVSGYHGVNDIFLAAERGEIQGNIDDLSGLLGKPDWMAAKKARILVQFGAERLAGLEDVPTAVELASDAAGKEAMRVYAMKFRTSYPILLPPDVPPQRVAALRSAFDETMTDPKFVADAQKIGVHVNPLSGADINQIMRDIDAAPQDVIDKLRKIISP